MSGHTRLGIDMFLDPTLPLDNQLSKAVGIHNKLVSYIENVKHNYSVAHARLHYCNRFLRDIENERHLLSSRWYNYGKNYNISKRGRLAVEMDGLREWWTLLLEEVKEAKQC
ncbi:MAG: hypothetical protein FRX48_08900 [Lasallia pustulata]|uniref:Uncharacterized protein n=1 Tax=Lasallia pustulata TaxID=136370 RepID=A0A5M8PF49_9LECA|nr:MAG: hypothetical protein FRX48_08900 [Lasallia pustulata]